MIEWGVVWGAGKIASLALKPILDELAKDVAKDAAKSYVQRCFPRVFSAASRDPLIKATARALKELLEEVRNELLDADLEPEALRDWFDDVRRFVDRDEVSAALGSLFVDPNYVLAPATLADAWRDIAAAHTLPPGFSWARVAKRFARKVRDIRQASAELSAMFDALADTRSSEDLHTLVGLPPDFDVDTYRQALLQRYENLHLDMLDERAVYERNVRRLWSVFVPQSVRECPDYYPKLLEIPKEHLKRLLASGEIDAEELAKAEAEHDARRREYFTRPIRSALDVANDPAAKKSVILGDPGSGKSSLLRYLALEWARIDDLNRRYSEPLPLLIELRDYNLWECHNGKSFPKYLNDAQNWCRLNQQTLDHLLKQPDRVVLLLDGLDEVFDSVAREHVVNDIHRFSNDYPHTRIVVTSRPVGYRPDRLRDASFQHFMLEDLDSGQIETFLGKWHSEAFDRPEDAEMKRARLPRAIHDSKPIAMLAGNPLLLTMMAILNSYQELPRDRAELYKQASRVLLHQWDTERALGDYPELRGQVDLKAKVEILQRIAFHMQTGPEGLAGNIIDGDALTDLIEAYLRDELSLTPSRAAAAALVRQLRERNFILCFLGADRYAFVHRTFLEYFCASEYVRRFNNQPQEMTRDELTALFDQHCRDDEWREVLCLICGQIHEKYVGQIVERLATRTDMETWDGETPLLELPLAILCLSEVRKIKQLEREGGILLDAVLEAFARNSSFDDFPNLIVKASQALAGRWPAAKEGREQVRSLCGHHPFDFWGGDPGHRLWPFFVAYLCHERCDVETLANDEDWTMRATALNVLAQEWPDDATRNLLENRAVEDGHEYVRCTALSALSEKWADDVTRNLLEQRAVVDESEYVGRTALEALSEKWPDDATRKLLEQRAVDDKSGLVRFTALRALSEKWPDDATRRLLERKAAEDESVDVRRTALRALPEKWPDDATRKLLEQRVAADDDWVVRSTALRALSEKWTDNDTRKLLEHRALVDESEYVGRTALEALSVNWPDEDTWRLVADRRHVDGCAASLFGGRHSRFGRIVFTRDLDGAHPYLDPAEPVSREHIERAAEWANVPHDRIDETVSSLSAHMGWDITKGQRT